MNLNDTNDDYVMSQWSPYVTSLGTFIICWWWIPLHQPTRRKLAWPSQTSNLIQKHLTCKPKFMPQARLSILILSKAYPTKGILSPLTRHEWLLAGGVCFAEKRLIVSPYFQVLAFRFQYRLTILDELLSTNKHGGNNYLSSTNHL